VFLYWFLVFVSKIFRECRKVVDCYKCLDFSIYVSVFVTTIVLPLSAWTIIVFSVTSFCFNCFKLYKVVFYVECYRSYLN